MFPTEDESRQVMDQGERMMGTADFRRSCAIEAVLTQGKCACCRNNNGVSSDEQSRGLGLSFCLVCMNASKDFANCPRCHQSLPYLERMGAAARQMLTACSQCVETMEVADGR